MLHLDIKYGLDAPLAGNLLFFLVKTMLKNEKLFVQNHSWCCRESASPTCSHPSSYVMLKSTPLKTYFYFDTETQSFVTWQCTNPMLTIGMVTFATIPCH